MVPSLCYALVSLAALVNEAFASHYTIPTRPDLLQQGVEGDLYDSIQGVKHIEYGPSHPFHPSRLEERRMLREMGEVDEFDNGQFSNMRIGFADLMGTDSTKEFSDTIIQPAIDLIQQALLVVPVPEGEFITAGNRYYAFPGDAVSIIPPLYRNPGVVGYDFFLLFYSNPAACGSQTIAFALTVSEDTFNRPLFGAVNFCPNALSQWQDEPKFVSAVTVHEIFHALGFSSDGICKFRDEFGKLYQELTSRGTCPAELSLCVNGEYRNVQTPSSKIFSPYTDRAGKVAYELTTEKVVAVAKSHFNCDKLTGVKFENQPTSLSCFGDHFDESQFYQDLMSPFAGKYYTEISPLNMAFFEDSHHYVANYSYSYVPSWGHGATCEFLDSTCNEILDMEASNTLPIELSNTYCTPTNPYKDLCDTTYQYYGYCNTELEQNDNCPVVNNYGNRDRCTNAVEDDSRCWSTYSQDGSPVDADCYDTRCITDSQTAVIKYKGFWRECAVGQDYLNIDEFSWTGNKIKCPNIFQMCPEFACLHSCSGRGLCNWSNSSCDCFNGNQNLSLTGCVDYGEIPNRTFYVGDKDITILDRIRRRWELIIDAFGRSPTEWTTEQFISVAFFIVFILIFVCLAVKLCSCCCEKKRGRPSGTAAATRRNREVIEQENELRLIEEENELRLVEEATRRSMEDNYTRERAPPQAGDNFKTQQELWDEASTNNQSVVSNSNFTQEPDIDLRKIINNQSQFA